MDPAAVALLESPVQLPVVLQVLLSQAHRVRALILLRRFLDLGPGAVNLALSVGIFPYVLKLLQSSIDEYKHVLVGIWAKILHFDPSCQVDLVKDGALPHFIRHLHWGLTTGPTTAMCMGSQTSPLSSGGDTRIEDAAEQRTMAAVILSAICRGYPLGQAECLKKGLHTVLSSLLSSVELECGNEKDTEGRNAEASDAGITSVDLNEARALAEERVPPLFRLWLCLCLGNLIKENVAAQTEAFKSNIHLRLFARLDDECPDVRAAACYALGCLLGSTPLPPDPSGNEEGSADNGVLPSRAAMAMPSQQPIVPYQPQAQIHPRGPVLGQQQGLPGVSLAAPITPQQSAGRPQTGMIPDLDGAGGVPALVPALMGAGGAMVLQPLPHPVTGAAAVGMNGAGQAARLLPQQHQPPQQMHPSLQQQSHPNQQQPLQPRGALLPGQLQQTQIIQYGPLGIQGIVPAGINGVPASTIQPPHPQQQPPPPGGAAVLPPFQLNTQHQQQPIHQVPSVLHPVQNQHPQLHAPHHSFHMQHAQLGHPQHQQVQLHQQYPQHPDHPSQTTATGPSPDSTEESRQRRINFDLAVADRLASTMAGDASPTVRYEATLSLAGVVRKHLPAFASAADDAAAKERQGESALEGDDAEKKDDENNETKDSTIDGGPSFAGLWSALHSMQHNDPHPILLAATNQVISAVNEYVLLSGTSVKDIGINSDSDPETENEIKHSRIHSIMGTSLPGAGAGTLLPPPLLGGRSTSVGAVPSPVALRRNQSDHAAMGQILSPFGMSAAGRPGEDTVSGSVTPRSALISPRISMTCTRTDIFSESGFYSLPESRFYEWKREEFADRSSGRPTDESYPPPLLDPLSFEGAIWSYREQRNAEVHTRSDALSKQYAALAYKPPRGRGRIEGLFDDLQDEAEAREAAKLEAEVSSKKSSLHLHQHAMLLNDGKKGSYMMQFHPYEPALIVCDGANSISVWDVNETKRSVSFSNGNPKGSRMTSASWMNEMTTSLLLAGSDDGTVRVWDGILDGFGRMSNEPPRLLSAFSAAPDLVAGQRGSGLVTEWQQFSGRLIAGGNSNLIRCWDIEAERCANALESNVGACVTTLTTAWDFDMFGYGGIGGGGALGSPSARGYSGIGPDIVVAGYGDGSLKVFDIRAQRKPVGDTPADLSNVNGAKGTRTLRARRKQLMQYAEHESWIVNTAFTTFGGRNEIVSGCVAGDIKFWDLRMQESLRTLDVQRSPMTALALHPGIPLLATGSHAQFIKILALDGDTLQVIRYHEEIAGQRIGPVSCLCFHPHKPLLAAGATDEIISLYLPDDAK